MHPNIQATMRQKVRTYNIFNGNKQYRDCEFRGDHLTSIAVKTVKKANNYNASVEQIQNQGESVIFACEVMRVNPKNKCQNRAIVVTEKNLFRLDASSLKIKKSVA